MWRILSLAEARQFRYDGDPWDWGDPLNGIGMERVGYIVMLKVRLHGHDHCACRRSMYEEEFHLFHIHPPTLQFPLHYTEMDNMLRNLNEIQIPRVIVTTSRSYGWLQ